MSEQQNNNAWIDVAISCLVIVIVLFSAWNTIATIRINKQMEMNSDGGIEKPIPTHVLISRELNNWEGWKCYAGVEQIIVDLNGSVWRG